MIAAKYRFHGHGALKFLFGHGRTYRLKAFSLRVARNSRRTHSRAAIVISKKVLKQAPKRNRVRRRLYEVLREVWPHIAEGNDLLVSVYDPGVLDCPYDDLLAEMKKALVMAHIWQDEAREAT